MRGLLGIAVLTACAQPAAPPAPVLGVTPSDQRATGDIVPQFTGEAAAGELKLTAMLGDRLEQDEFPGPSIQLTPSEHLFAVLDDTRVPLVEEIYPVPGFGGSILWTRYSATIPTDATQLAIEFDRADGSIATSTLNVPARFALASPLPPDIKSGDRVTFSIAPAPAADTWGYWRAWCNAAPATLVGDYNVAGVYVGPDGAGNFQFGDADTGTRDCAGKLQLALYALGDYDPAFGASTGPITSTHPMGLQDVTVSTHLWGIAR